MTRPDVIVIGAGLAGASTAFALATRGVHVRLIESASGLCERASGNRFGLLTPYIATHTSPTEALYSLGYTWTRGLLTSSAGADSGFTASGAIQFPSTKRFATILSHEAPLVGAPTIQRATAAECSEFAGIPCHEGGFIIPSAGFVSPRRFMNSLLRQFPRQITTTYSLRATTLKRTNDAWRISCSDGTTHEASHVVICGAFESSQLSPTSWLPLEPIRGQTVCTRESEISARLRAVLCFGGYLTPSVDGEHLLGAHYRHHDDNDSPSDLDTQEILHAATRALPALPLSSEYVRSARVCFRTSTVDRLPYIGQAPNFQEMRDEASTYQSGTNVRNKVPLRSYSGLYVNVGHGSRGLLSCPLGGEIIARLINNEPISSLATVAQICDPARVPYRLLTTELHSPNRARDN